MSYAYIHTSVYVLQQEVNREEVPKEFTFREFQEYMISNSSDILGDSLVD